MDRRYKVIFSLSISCIFLLYFLYRINISAFLDQLKSASIQWLFAGVFFFVLQILIKALRFHSILEIDSSKFKHALGIQGKYSILRQILPSGLNEISILYLFKRGLGINYSRSASALFFVRLLDLLLFSLFFLFLYFFAYELVYSNEMMVYVMKIMLIVAILLIIMVSLFLSMGRFVQQILDKSFLKEKTILYRFFRFVSDFQQHFRKIFTLRKIIYLIYLSVILWFVTYFVFFSGCKAIRANLTYLEILFVYLALWPFEFLPIRGIGNLGSHELGWVVCLSLLGYSQEFAILIAFGTHIIFYFNLVVIGILVLVLYHRDFMGTFRESLRLIKNGKEEKHSIYKC